MTLRCIFFFCLLCWLTVSPAVGIDYDRDIRPLLADTCFNCHGPDEAERKADLRLDTKKGLLGIIQAGKPEQSELFNRISSPDPEEKMPPPDFHRSLSPDRIATIRQWIEEGAAWKGHWAFETVHRPELPEVRQTEWVKNPIDTFVLARLEKEGRQPSPRADPAILGRRLWFDLTGLPPTPQETAEFAKKSDVTTTAEALYQKAAHAERMTSRWLDAARYADTSGYQSDGWRTMWRWRDWVIDAYRRNQSFDRFTITQLAGDLLPDATLNQKIATGFNRNHRGNSEGGIVPEEFEVEYVVDRVDTTFTVWQGVTMGCARCHNHKYDPFTHRDYYRLFAFFNRVPEFGRALKEGNSEPSIKAPTAEQTAILAQLKHEESKAKNDFAVLSRRLEQQIHSWNHTRTKNPQWQDYNSLVADSAQSDGNVAKFGYFDRFTLGARISAKPGTHGTILSKMVPAAQGHGYSLDLTTEGHLQLNLVKRWLDDALRVETIAPIPLNGESTHVMVTYDGSRRARGIEFYINGEIVSHRANLDFLNQSFETAEPLRVGAGNSDFNGEIEGIEVYSRVLDDTEILATAEPFSIADIRAIPADDRSVSQKNKLEQYYLHLAGPELLRKVYRKAIDTKRTRARFERDLPTVMVMEDSVDRPAYILQRGQYDLPGEQVNAGVPSSLPPLQAGAPRNRLGLAKWLVSRENPLTARVTVNRLWRDLFGTGLVRTTEDFGVQGERPSHPELLDWLAVEFMESGWDIQHILTLIVSSNTYQQSSRSTLHQYRLDPENRLLARGPRFRLPAEMIRDQALAVSGLLYRKVGGPSVKTYQPEGLWSDIASDGKYTLAEGPDLYRRSLYSYWKRTVPPPMMMNFDSSGRETCEVGLRRTNTPMQALNLMNDITFVEPSRVLAQAILKQAKSDRINEAFLRILHRNPDSTEIELLQNSLSRYLAKYRNNADAAKALISIGSTPHSENCDPAELAAWTMICSTLFNLDEAVTKE